MNFVFFSDQNISAVKDKINNSVEFTYGFSITENSKYQDKILETMRYIYNNREKLNLPIGKTELELSEFLSDKSIKYFMLSFEKSMNKEEDESRSSYLEQPELESRYNTQNLNDYESDSNLNFNNKEIDKPLNTAYSIEREDIPVFEKRTPTNSITNTNDFSINKTESDDIGDKNNYTKNLFYPIKNTEDYQLSIYNIVIDTVDTGLEVVNALYNPFKVNVKFGENKNNSNNIYIEKEFNNVHSIHLKRIVIPSKIAELNHPFLYLCLSEYKSNIVTSRNIPNIFSKIYLDNNTSQICSSVLEGTPAAAGDPSYPSYAFLHYINSDNNVEFKAPLSKLTSLNMFLVSPNGEHLSYTAPLDTTQKENHYVQYMFEITTIENYVPHLNFSPFNS